MTRADAMHRLLEHLLDQPEHKDGLGAQIVTTASSSTIIAGAIRRGPVKGTFSMRNLAELKDTKQKAMIDVYFTGEDVLQLHVLTPVDEPLIKAGGLVDAGGRPVG